MTQHETALITVAGVRRTFGDYTALDGITFTVQPREMLVIIGPNGSGKSTLAKIMVGLDEPSAGSVRVHGMPPRDAVKKIGYVPQYFAFDRTLPMTVEEFLALVPCTVGRHQEQQAIRDTLELVSMQEQRRKQLGILSGGQLQRVLIARALLHERNILVLDEPSASIDVSGEQQIFDLLKRLQKERGTTSIVISHEMDIVTKYATTVLCLDRTMVCHGAPETVLTPDVMQRLYGTPTTAFHTTT